MGPHVNSPGPLRGQRVIVTAVRYLLPCLCGLCLAGSARAETSAPDTPGELEDSTPRRTGGTRLAVLLLATGELDQELADNLTEVLIASVASHTEAQIVGKAEFQAILDRQDEASQACIESPTCLGRIGVQPGL